MNQKNPEQEISAKPKALPKSDKRAGVMVILLIVVVMTWEWASTSNLWPTGMTQGAKDLFLIIPCFFFTLLYLYSIEDQTSLWAAEQVSKIKKLLSKPFSKTR